MATVFEKQFWSIRTRIENIPSIQKRGMTNFRYESFKIAIKAVSKNLENAGIETCLFSILVLVIYVQSSEFFWRRVAVKFSNNPKMAHKTR